MSLSPFLCSLGLSGLLTLSGTVDAKYTQKIQQTTNKTAVTIEKVCLLNDTIRHTFVIDENKKITVLLNQFQTYNGGIEKYLQVVDCLGNEYMIFVRNGYFQVSRTDKHFDRVVWYDEAMTKTGGVQHNNTTDNDDELTVKDPVPSVREILSRIQSQGSITPLLTDDGVVYKLECV